MIKYSSVRNLKIQALSIKFFLFLWATNSKNRL